MKKVFILVLIACLLLPQLAYAGAWTVPQKNVWSQYTVKWNWAKSAYQQDGNPDRLARDGRAWGWSMGPEIHIGITDWLNLLGLIEYKEGWYKEYSRPIAWGPYSVKNHGVTNVDLAAKIRLLQKPLVVSTQFKFSIWNPSYENKVLQDVAEQPGLSDRANGFEWRWQFGRFFDKKMLKFFTAYAGLETGYRWNYQGFADQVPLFGEVGFWPCKWLLVKTEIDSYFAINRTGPRTKSYAIWRIGPVVQLYTIYQLMRGVDVSAKEYTSDVTRAYKSFNVEAQYGNTFWGENTSRSQEVVLKVSAQF